MKQVKWHRFWLYVPIGLVAVFGALSLVTGNVRFILGALPVVVFELIMWAVTERSQSDQSPRT